MTTTRKSSSWSRRSSGGESWRNRRSCACSRRSATAVRARRRRSAQCRPRQVSRGCSPRPRMSGPHELQSAAQGASPRLQVAGGIGAGLWTAVLLCCSVSIALALFWGVGLAVRVRHLCFLFIRYKHSTTVQVRKTSVDGNNALSLFFPDSNRDLSPGWEEITTVDEPLLIQTERSPEVAGRVTKATATADHFSVEDSEFGQSPPLSAEAVAKSLLLKFANKKHPAASELHWLVSYQDAPQSLLPLPETVAVAPDDALSNGAEVPSPPKRRVSLPVRISGAHQNCSFVSPVVGSVPCHSVPLIVFVFVLCGLTGEFRVIPCLWSFSLWFTFSVYADWRVRVSVSHPREHGVGAAEAADNLPCAQRAQVCSRIPWRRSCFCYCDVRLVPLFDVSDLF